MLSIPDKWQDGKFLTVNKVINDNRRMMSRRRGDGIRLLKSLTPGSTKAGCCVCCSAPSCCPMFSTMPCCDDAKYVMKKREGSKYVFVRENSLEWNEPEIMWLPGNFLGIDPCAYGIQDNLQVMYYDDPMFDNMSDKTRACNETRTCVCGGHGERIQFSSTCCFNTCYRSSFPLPCVPLFIPSGICPCARMREIYLQDAAEGIHVIRQAVRNAREHDPLYSFSENADAARWSEMTSADGESADGESAAQHLQAERQNDTGSSTVEAVHVEAVHMVSRFESAKPPEPPTSWDS